MSEYEVTVYTRVREVYTVEADNAEEAKRNWIDGDLVISECMEVEEVFDPVELD